MKKKLSVGISVFCILVAGCMALLLTPIFSVETIIVTGNKTISTEEIILGSGIVRGSNIFSINLGAVKKKISYMSGIDTVQVKRSLPSTIRITVTEGNPIVYVENMGDLVGLTADGKVVEIISAGSLPSSVPEPPAEEGEAADGEPEEPVTEDAPEPPADNPALTGRTVVYGMGEMEYSVGKTIRFSDEKKSENLLKLMGEFLCDSMGRDFTQVDMSIYDNITLLYRGRLNVRLGSAEQLEYKLNCFKTIIGDYLEADTEGTLDLERLTYSPKK